MPITHQTPPDGSFSPRGKGAWEEAHTLPTADEITVIQSGTGAIAETVEEAARNGLVSVMSWIPVAERAAIRAGTSTTDVASYIQSCIDNNQGRVIFFPKGTYMIGSSINLKTQRTLLGERSWSIIKALSSWNPSVPTITAGSHSPTLSFAPMLYNKDPISGNKIMGLTLNGNDEDCYGLYLHENFYCHIEDVLILNTNKRPYTNIRGQAVVHVNLEATNCDAGVVTYDNTNFVFIGGGLERLGTDWFLDQRQPNSFSKGGVSLIDFWFESASGAAPSAGFLRMSGRRNRVSANFSFHDTATTERMLELNDNTASVVVDGITMEAQACQRGYFEVNNPTGAMLIKAATGSSGNRVTGTIDGSLVDDDGTGNTFDINGDLATPVQHITGRFQVRAGDTGSGISNTAAQYAIDADWNAGDPEVRLLANDNNKFSLSSGQLRLGSNGNMQLNPGGNLACIQTNGAFSPPTLNTTQRDALTAANAMLVYNSTRGTFEGRIAGAWRALRGVQVSADNGDAAATLLVASDEPTQLWATTLTEDRAVALSTTAVANGDKFRIVRTADGAFNLNVGTGPLAALVEDEWCDVEYNGSAWILTAKGSLA